MSEIAAENLNVGDIFYVEVNNTFYFLQVIQSVISDNPYQKFGYFLVVFDKKFQKLPSSIQALDLNKIYINKYVMKKTVLFAGIWSAEPNIKFTQSLMYYDLKDKYQLKFFANTEVSQQFNPQLALDFSYSVVNCENADGIQTSYQHLGLQVIFWVLEQEEKGKDKKRIGLNPRYFKSWVEYVEPEHIIGLEKALSKFEDAKSSNKTLQDFKKCLQAINKLEEKWSFIFTIEAEDISEKLFEIALKKGLSESAIKTNIELLRDW